MPYQVQAYSFAGFRELLVQYSDASPQVVDAKLRSRYFPDYFATLGVQTIVVEENYVDHDYLEDFAAYYVKCFHSYRRTCTRLHFFKATFDTDEFCRHLRGESDLREALCQSYAGFIVVRPLPESIIGRTCLATYESESGRRRFPTVFLNAANLFGLDLTIKTLPFQEQDHVTAACATSALWSAFQATGRLFHHRLPSPVEITSAATLRMPVRTRVLPNTNGLTIEQMAHAIREVGLEPYFIAADDPSVLRAAIHAYVSGGIPPLLVIRLSGEQSGKRSVLGSHAVAVTGYSLPSVARSRAGAEFQSDSDAIDKLYVHDDQVGPHARMELAGSGDQWHLTTSWGLGGPYANIQAQPVALLLPLYNKIRIPFTRPLGDLLEFDSALAALGISAISDTLVWSLRLTTVNRLKAEVLSAAKAYPDLREEILGSALPRFMWHASATNAAGPVADILFDATDIDSGRYVARIDVHDTRLRAVIDHVRAHLTSTNVGAAIAAFYGKLSKTD